ncbi:MAG: thioredoxin family protein [Actinomycetia bacterium]|nr:thioredoxin family protein [Actinomycetes bacterium]MCH9800920.1 thioredoxin family protein [Actinomycetes bacterium]
MSRPGALEQLMTHSLTKRRRLALMLTPVATALVLAGCASGNDTDAASESAAPSPATSSPAAEASKDSSKKSDSKSPAAPAGYVSYSDYSKNKAQYDDADVVLFFNASWCSTCAEADQQLSSEQFPDGLVVVSVDYDANEDLRQQYGVTVQHTYVQVNPDGSEVTKFSGATSVGEISEQLA